MNTVVARTRTVGIVLGIAAALVLGFGPRANADPAATPAPMPTIATAPAPMIAPTPLVCPSGMVPGWDDDVTGLPTACVDNHACIATSTRDRDCNPIPAATVGKYHTSAKADKAAKAVSPDIRIAPRCSITIPFRPCFAPVALWYQAVKE